MLPLCQRQVNSTTLKKKKILPHNYVEKVKPQKSNSGNLWPGYWLACRSDSGPTQQA